MTTGSVRGSTTPEQAEWSDGVGVGLYTGAGGLGFIAADRQGRTVTYRVVDPCAEAFIALARDFLRTNDAAVGSCTILDREPANDS